MSPSTCPDTPDLQAILEHGDATGQSDDVFRHLDTCVACQQALETLAGDVAAWEEVAHGLGEVVWNEPALQYVVAKLKTDELLVSEDKDLSFLRPADKPGLVGLFGSYGVLGEIGRGGMGIVLKALDPILNRVVALKVLSPRLATSATARRRFLREGRAAAAVCHDHIVTVHGVSEADGLPYLVMQHITGESLQDRLDRTGPLELEEIVQIGLQTAAGLAAAHAQGLIHRDIKPANLLLESLSPPIPLRHEESEPRTRVKITDFGLARLTDDVQLTQNGVLAGTPEYMAPEQARGEQVDHRADLFSLGSVLYAMGTGISPFRGSTTLALIRQVSEETPTPMRTLNPDVPEWLEALVSRLMAKNPADRLQNAAELAKLLEGYSGRSATVPAPAPAPAPETPAPIDDSCLAGPSAKAQTGYALRLQSPLWVAAFLLLASVALGLGAWFTGAAGQLIPETPRVQEYHQSFKSAVMSPDFEFCGANAIPCVEFTPDGLRIALPAGWPGERPGTGVTTRKPITGDFEITVTFEFLQDPQPGESQTLFSVDVVLDKPGNNYASICRSVAPDGKTNFLTWMSQEDEHTSKPSTRGQGFPTKTKSGRLRLVRLGSVLSYFVAEGSRADFRLLQQHPFGKEDIKEVRFLGSTGGSKASLDVRVTDLGIRWGVLPDIPADSSPKLNAQNAPPDAPRVAEPEEARPRSRVWLATALLAGLGLILGLATLASITLFLRKRLPARTVSPGGTDHPAKQGSVFVACPKCRKKLKIKTGLAGKKVKCPECGELVLVPAAPPTVPKNARSVATKVCLLASLGLGCAGLALVLLGVWFYQPATPPITSFLDIPLGNKLFPGVADAGFHHDENDGEGPFRWTNGKGKLVIPLTKNDRPQALLVQLDRPVNCSLQITVNNREVLKEEPSPNRMMWWEKTIDLSGVQLGTEVVVEIVSNTRPDQTNDARRDIGVSVRGIKLLSRRGEEKLEEKTRPSTFLNVPLGGYVVPRIEESGFHPTERGMDGRFRWTKNKAKLVIPLHKNERPQAILVQLGLPRTRSVRITVNGHELLDETASEQGPVVSWLWEKTLDVSGIDLGDKVTVEISSNVQPLLVDPRGEKTDARELGVALRAIKLLGANK